MLLNHQLLWMSHLIVFNAFYDNWDTTPDDVLNEGKDYMLILRDIIMSYRLAYIFF